MKNINENKIKKLNINKENTYVVIDFDRTITTANSDDSWDATGKLLGDIFNKKLLELYNFYRPIELDYTITFEKKDEEMIKWYKECMDLYYENKLTKSKLDKSINKSKLIFRQGAKEFLQKLNKYNIPVIILSAGIGNVIEKFLENNKCYYENIFIISNFIEFDENENMKKFTNNLIYSLNKTQEGHLINKVEKQIENRPYALLFGDLVEDIKMVSKNSLDSTITVGFINEKVSEDLEIYKQNFDIVLSGNSATFDEAESILRFFN